MERGGGSVVMKLSKNKSTAAFSQLRDRMGEACPRAEFFMDCKP